MQMGQLFEILRSTNGVAIDEWSSSYSNELNIWLLRQMEFHFCTLYLYRNRYLLILLIGALKR